VDVALGGALEPDLFALAMSDRKKTPASLEKKIGHRFKDKSLLTQALTHVSAIGGGKLKISYQRFEFLGDHVLGLTISDLLLREFTNAQEGELSQRLSDLVRKETCAEVGLELDLGSYVYFGQHELQSGGRKKKTIIADVCEAVIGAVYLDGGFQAAAKFVNKYWRPRALAPGRELRDAKTRLQEWAQKQGLPPPSYRQVERKGPDHKPVFRIAVEVQGIVSGEGVGATKRDAERAAAEAALQAQGIKIEG
jgi:ribonuclease III